MEGAVFGVLNIVSVFVFMGSPSSVSGCTTYFALPILTNGVSL